MNTTGVVLFVMVLAAWGCLSHFRGQGNDLPPSSEWIEISEENFRLRIPKGLIREDKTGFDGYAARYSNSEITVAIESGAGTEKLNGLKQEDRVINFVQETVTRAGIRGLEAAFEFEKDRTNFEDPNKPNVRLLSIDCRLSSESISFMVLFSNLKNEDIANSILGSARISCSE